MLNWREFNTQILREAVVKSIKRPHCIFFYELCRGYDTFIYLSCSRSVTEADKPLAIGLSAFLNTLLGKHMGDLVDSVQFTN